MITGPYFSARDTSWELLSVEVVPSASADLAVPLLAIGRSSDLALESSLEESVEEWDSELEELEELEELAEAEGVEGPEESVEFDESAWLERIENSSVIGGARGNDFKLVARVTRKSDQALDWLVRGRS